MASIPGQARQLRGGLILASASPRRRMLLASAGLEFEVEPSEVDEGLDPGVLPEEAAVELALRKAREVAGRHRGRRGWTIGSDTIVALGTDPDAVLLPKPADEREARSMLERLSGSRHRVLTGVAVIDMARFGGDDGPGVHSAFERTWVTMRGIQPVEIERYVASGEWRGKAGGYAIQETADAFVVGLEEGGFDNVVGLPLGLTLDLLDKAGAFLAP